MIRQSHNKMQQKQVGTRLEENKNRKKGGDEHGVLKIPINNYIISIKLCIVIYQHHRVQRLMLSKGFETISHDFRNSFDK